MATGHQHGGRENDDLQNWLDMTSYENPLLLTLIVRIDTYTWSHYNSNNNSNNKNKNKNKNNRNMFMCFPIPVRANSDQHGSREYVTCQIGVV